MKQYCHTNDTVSFCICGRCLTASSRLLLSHCAWRPLPALPHLTAQWCNPFLPCNEVVFYCAAVHLRIIRKACKPVLSHELHLTPGAVTGRTAET
mgnify:CR=1 FL=1